MRWRFPVDLSREEADERAEVLARVDSWWRAFRGSVGRLDALFRGRQEWDLPAFMQETLQAIHPGLMWEFGSGRHGGHRLVVTPELRRWLRPLADVVLSRAPHLDGWEFLSYRPGQPPGSALGVVEARTGHDLSSVTVEARVGPAHRVDLAFRGDPVPELEPAFLLAEGLLGEELVERCVGCVETGPREGSEGEPDDDLSTLRQRVERLADLIVQTVPSEPCHVRVDHASWSELELSREDEEEEVEDYERRSDILQARTMDLELWKTAQLGRAFTSSRFSRSGETFAFVKMDARGGLPPGSFREGPDVEAALDAALRPAGLGCVIGGATGRVYTYVDLALAQVDRGCDVVRDVLLAGGVPERTWILFFDDAWAHEWVPVHAGAPAPALPEPD